MNGDKEDPRYSTEKSSMMMRKALSDLSKNTHKFIQETSELTKKAEYCKYRSYIEERDSYRAGFDPRYHTSSVRKELSDTLSKLQKVTHTFVREHDELANKAEYLKFKDFVSQREKNQQSNK